MNDKEFLHDKFGYNTQVVTNKDECLCMFNEFMEIRPKYAGYDTETTGLHHMTALPFLIVFGFDKYLYVCDNSNKEVFATFIETMFDCVRELGIMLFAHNAKYDRHMLINNGTPVPEYIKLADSITLARLISPCDDTFASMKLESIGARYVDSSAKFAGELIKDTIQKLKKERKKVVCDNYRNITGEKKFTDAWDTYVDRIQHITEYHEAFEDYKDPNYYDVYLKEPDLMIKYAFDDVVIMLEFIKKAIPIYTNKYTKNGGVNNEIFFRENKLIHYIGDVERNGFCLDIDYLIDCHYKVSEYKDLLYKKLNELTGESWKVGQHQKIIEYFNNVHSIEMGSADKKAIGNLLKVEDEKVTDIAKIIVKLRTVDKWLSTYIDGLLNKSIYVDGQWKLYTTINNAGTVSGRVSSDLQQMPKYAIKDLNDEELFMPRKAIIPSPNTILVFEDMSQVELRGQAEFTILAGEPDYNLCRAYMPYGCINLDTFENFDYNNRLHIETWHSPSWINKDGSAWEPTDLHSATTMKAFPELDTHSDEFKKARYLGKMTNFASNYQVGTKTLAINLDVDYSVAEKLRNSYKETFPGVATYNKMVTKMLQLKGFVENLYGRKYYLDSSDNYYKAGNYLIQGTCADGLKDAEVKICEYLKDKKSKMIMAIHDEVVIEVAIGEEYVIPEIKLFMESISERIKHVPIVCEVEYTTTNWGEKQKYEI